MFCHVPATNVMAVHDCKSVYHVPLLLKSQGLLDVLQSRLHLSPKVNPSTTSLLTKWTQLTDRINRLQDTVSIALVGKYTHLHDSYISVVKSLEHAALSCNRKIEIQWIEATDLEQEMLSSNPLTYHESWKKLCSANGILVPGGFGTRGSEGKIQAVKWARENKIPYLGICLGMQIAVIEYARHVCGLTGANSEELDPKSPHKVVIYMPEIDKENLGGTMRLGKKETQFVKNGIAKTLYGSDIVYERHRHRYEVNPEYVKTLEDAGLKFVGHDERGERMIICELPGTFISLLFGNLILL